MATSENSERVSCTFDECITTFSRQADMERHLAEHHGPVKRCHVPGCSWEGARRSSRVQEHMKKAHPEIYDVALIVPNQFGATSVPVASQEDVNQDPHTPEAQPAVQGLCSADQISASGGEISNPAQFARSSPSTNPWQDFTAGPYQTFNDNLAPQLQIPMAVSEGDYQNRVQSFQPTTNSSQPTDSAEISNLPEEGDSLVEPEETMGAQQSYSWTG